MYTFIWKKLDRIIPGGLKFFFLRSEIQIRLNLSVLIFTFYEIHFKSWLIWIILIKSRKDFETSSLKDFILESLLDALAAS